MKVAYWNQLNIHERNAVLQRPAIKSSASIEESILEIEKKVSRDGDQALLKLTEQYDNIKLTSIKVSDEEIESAGNRLGNEIKSAISQAYENINKFHIAQKFIDVDIETQPGIRCQVVSRPINKVGLYIPGGTAPLFSTVLMLGIPAQIAQCKKIVLCSPPSN